MVWVLFYQSLRLIIIKSTIIFFVFAMEKIYKFEKGQAKMQSNEYNPQKVSSDAQFSRPEDTLMLCV